MKKFMFVFLVLSIYLFDVGISIAKEPVKGSIKVSSIALYAPTWDEFCPAQFVNAQYVDADALHGNGFVDTVLNLSIIGWPIANARLKKYEDAIWGNYWVQRKKSFEKEINICLADESTALVCFMQVRQIEDNKTAVMKNQSLIQQQIGAQYAQMGVQAAANVQSQLQAQQMNNNLNNINSSINNFNSNLNTNLNTSNSNLHAINHNLNRINQTLRH